MVIRVIIHKGGVVVPIIQTLSLIHIFEAGTPVFVEPLLKYDPLFVWILTRGTGTLIGG